MSEYLHLLDTYARAVLAMRQLQQRAMFVKSDDVLIDCALAENEVDQLTALHLSPPLTTPDATTSPPTAKNGSGVMTSLVPTADVESCYKRLMKLVRTLTDLHAAPMSFRNPHYYEQRLNAMAALRAFVVEKLGDQLGADQGAEGGAP